MCEPGRVRRTFTEIAESVRSGEVAMCVVVLPTTREDCVALSDFGGVAIEATPDAFPLQMHCSRGCGQDLHIYPKAGEVFVEDYSLELRNRRTGATLTIYRRPYQPGC